MDFIAHAKKTLTIEQNGIAAISQQLDDTFNTAIQALIETIERNGKIVIAGVGKNWHIGNKIAATFNSTGSPAAVMHPIEAMHGDFGLLSDSDLLVAVSYSGASEEITALIPPVKRRKIPIIALTAEADSPLARHSDIVLNITVPEEACPFNMAPTASTTATLALGDALAMVLLHARGSNWATMLNATPEEPSAAPFFYPCATSCVPKITLPPLTADNPSVKPSLP